MWACLTRLKDGLNLLRHYLEGLDKQDALLALQCDACGQAEPFIAQLQEHFRLQNNKSQYDYNTIIISLYGYLERFIEDLIGEYLDQVSSAVAEFANLPPAVQANHLMLSLELARKADYQKYASSVRVEDVVAKLHACFTTPAKYQLNARAFAQHTSNFRHAVVSDTFKQCGITGIAPSIRRAEPFISFLTNENPDRDVETHLAREDDVVFYRLNDLANRRNDVAHGSFVDDILSRDLLRTYVDFIEAYGEGLALVVYERTLPFLLERAVGLGTPLRVINNRIVCVDFPAGQLAVGDMLIAKTADTSRPFKGGPIKEIQQNSVSLNTVSGGDGVQIGICVEFGAKQNQEFYYFRSAP